MVWEFHTQKWAARARPTTPKAGALPKPTASFRSIPSGSQRAGLWK